MSSNVEISYIEPLKNGSMKTVTVAGREVLVARVGDKYYAVQNRCPHMGGDLSHGKLAGTVITCPLHRSQFDLSDGHVIRWTDWTGMKLSFVKMLKAPRGLKTYEVRVEGNKVVVGDEKR